MSWPSEKFDIELKTWLDLKQPRHIAGLVKALLALRNNNGGYLFIGFNDKTQRPDPLPRKFRQPRRVYSSDMIQRLVSDYASDPFGIAIEFVKRERRDHPVVVVPAGILYPVAINKDLMDGGKQLLRKGDLYFRSLAANGSVSSAVAAPSDWKRIMDVCFLNREADIGVFIRKHLSAIGNAELPPELRDRCNQFIQKGFRRFSDCHNDWQVNRKIPYDHTVLKSTWEAVVVFDPPLVHTANLPFLNSVMAAVPANASSTGLFLTDRRGWPEGDGRPVQISDGFESLCDGTNPIQFWRIEPSGSFYHGSTMFEDRPGQVLHLDPMIAIQSVASTCLAAIAIAGTLHSDVSKLKIGCLFRWRGLTNRNLKSGLSWFTGNVFKAVDTKKVAFISLPGDAAPNSIAPYVIDIVKPLFATFDGASLDEKMVENAVQRLARGSMPD
jgi:hypothetical protein